MAHTSSWHLLRPDRRRRIAALILLCFLVDQGCSSKPSLQPVTYQAWMKELASRRGAVVVVPVWASWCRDCIDLLPTLAGFSEKYRDKGVTFLSLCLDDTADQEGVAAAGKIVAVDARLQHFLLQQDIAASFAALDLRDLPAVLVYDQRGEIRYRLTTDPSSNQIDPSDVEDAIESLL